MEHRPSPLRRLGRHLLARTGLPNLRLLAKLLPGLGLSAALLAGPGHAGCEGVNLIGELPAEARAEMDRRVQETPYASGNFWRATRGDEVMTVIGTYHFDDSRHDPAVEVASGLIAEAGVLLVEGGPEELTALKRRLGQDPSLFLITDGPTLLESLPEDTWKQLSQAMEARGIPGFMTAKFKPWYISMMLSIPPCGMVAAVEPRGLDGSLIEVATELQVPVQALEPYDTLFSIFGDYTPEQEREMIVGSLAMEGRSQDFSATLADLYFAGESRVIWELSRVWSTQVLARDPALVDAEMALMEEGLMNRRNKSWIPVIEAAAKAHDAPLVVAFGALHLSGQDGVLNLLAQRGWTLERIEF